MKGSVLAPFAAGVLIFAQGAGTQDAPKRGSMTGCLRAEVAPSPYMLTDLERGPKQLELSPRTESAPL
jgi:hypothetical protein